MQTETDLPTDIAGHALADLVRDIVADGRKPIETPDMPDAIAVHDLRKAFKRWRAILRLIAPVIGPEAELLRVEVRDLGRQFATARDGRAALAALADLGDDTPNLSPRSRATITGRLGHLVAGAEAASMTPDLKVRVGAAWIRASDALARWPIWRFDGKEATKQLAENYRRVRNSAPVDWSAATPEELHKFRQRVVEHRYQMELVEALWPKFIRVWVSEAQRLRDRLGAYQDLTVLLRLTEPHQPLSPWRSRLTPLILQRQAEHVASAKRLAGRLLAEHPKAFRQRLAALWEHHEAERDATELAD